MCTMKFEQDAKVDVADPVTVCDHEGSLLEPGLQALYAASGECFGPGIHQMNCPVFAFARARLDLSTGKIHGHATAQVVVVQKVALNLFAFITESYEKLIQTVMRVMLHDVPEDGTAANFHHRLWLHFGLFGQARADSTRENHNFHTTLPSPTKHSSAWGLGVY